MSFDLRERDPLAGILLEHPRKDVPSSGACLGRELDGNVRHAVCDLWRRHLVIDAKRRFVEEQDVDDDTKTEHIALVRVRRACQDFGCSVARSAR